MDKASVLAQLKDIHLPNQIGWWPPAAGWWFVMVIILVFFVWLSWRSWLWWQAMKPKRQALKILDRLEKEAKTKAAVSSTCAQISQLLRRVALTYYPVEQVAGLKNEEWIAFLNNHSKNINFNAVKEHLLVYPYKYHAKGTLTPLFDRSRRWIKQRREPCLK